jgi:uncharacterized MAPEG superfamily protein
MAINLTTVNLIENVASFRSGGLRSRQPRTISAMLTSATRTRARRARVVDMAKKNSAVFIPVKLK